MTTQKPSRVKEEFTNGARMLRDGLFKVYAGAVSVPLGFGHWLDRGDQWSPYSSGPDTLFEHIRVMYEDVMIMRSMNDIRYLDERNEEC